MLTVANLSGFVPRAAKRARESGQPYMVCEMDHEEGRKVYVSPYSYVREDEFWAFDGEVLLVVHPDGTVER